MSQSVIDQGASAQQERADYARYTRIAILLHWLIAIAIFFQLWSGLLVGDVFSALKTAPASVSQEDQQWAVSLLQTHKSIGLVVLVLSLGRLAWRLTHIAPPLPAGMPGWQRLASHASHTLLYLAMIGAPLTGWLYASTTTIDTYFFDAFKVPHAPGVKGDATIGVVASWAHWLIAVGMILVLLAHIGAALKHHFVDKDAILSRMTPVLRPMSGGALIAPVKQVVSLGRRLAALGLTAVVIILIGAAIFAYIRGSEICGDGREYQAGFGCPPNLSGESLDKGTSGGGAAAQTGASVASGATVWTPDYSASSVQLGLVAGGTDTKVTLPWTGQIAFDPEALDKSSVSVEFNMAGAMADQALAQSTMLSADWLGVEMFPKAVFKANRFEKGAEDGTFTAIGSLELHGETNEVTLPFTLKIDGDRAEMTAKIALKRLDYKIGVGAAAPMDADESVDVEIKVVATKQ